MLVALHSAGGLKVLLLGRARFGAGLLACRCKVRLQSASACFCWGGGALGLVCRCRCRVLLQGAAGSGACVMLVPLQGAGAVTGFCFRVLPLEVCVCVRVCDLLVA